MRSCSIVQKLEIVRGGLEDYKELGHFHYRDEGEMTQPFAAIFAIRPVRRLEVQIGKKAVGVIVYTMPSPGLELRNAAMGNVFSGMDRVTRLSLMNKNIRCISRVIIEPRFRGLGLARELVRETMPKMKVPIVESMAVMGLINPFFEKAGMKAYKGKMPARCVQMTEALSVVGIEQDELIDAEKVQRKLDRLGQGEAEFIERQKKKFLESYGKRKQMPPGAARTGYILSKLTSRPVYYIWFNPEVTFGI